MAAQPIYNPPIPYLAHIPGGAYPGRMIRVQGSVPQGAQRFAINLQCGPNTDPRDDIALHLNFRFVERCVVRNNLIQMQWGPEETSGGLPLTPGAGFEVLILCDQHAYKIALNGMHFCEFIHRVPYQRVSHLTIDGEVHVSIIGFEGDTATQQPGVMAGGPDGGYMAGFGAPAYGGGPPPPYSSQPIYAQSTPMMQGMPGGGMVTQQVPRSGGIGTGTALGLGVGGMAAAGLAGYALGGGFSSDSPEHENVNVAESFDAGDTGDFGGDGWMD